jgi:hypothetical protein
MKMSQPSNYRSYLLRMWRDSARASWQASLQSTATEKVHYFPDVDHVWVFLQAVMVEGGDDPEAGDAPPGESD